MATLREELEARQKLDALTLDGRSSRIGPGASSSDAELRHIWRRKCPSPTLTS